MCLQFNFIGPIDCASIISLQTFIAGQNGLPQHLQINFSSIGGELTPAIALYNYLKKIPTEITTHNIGEVSSAAVLPYLAGNIRTATPSSRFTIHPIRCGGNNLSIFQVEEMLMSLRTDINSYAHIVNTETNSLNGLANVHTCLESHGIVFNVETAFQAGLTTHRSM